MNLLAPGLIEESQCEPTDDEISTFTIWMPLIPGERAKEFVGDYRRLTQSVTYVKTHRVK